MGNAYKMSLKETVKDQIGSWRKDFFLGVTIPAYYNRRKTAPLDEKKVLFVEYRSGKLTDNFALLYAQLKAQKEWKISFHNLNHAFARHKEYAARCFKLLDDLATAKYVFINDANEIISCLDLRPETRVIQVWHASGAFKKWGMSTAKKGFGADARKLRRHPNYRNLDLVTVSSPEVIWAYAEAMDLEEKQEIIQAVGVSRTDVFFDPRRVKAARRRLEEKFPAARGKKVILYAPTFRGRVTSAVSPDALDYGRLRELLGEEYVLAVNRHPYVKKPDRQCDGIFSMDLTGELTISELMMASDMMLTDYSSAVFEYSLMEKPMVFFAYDLDVYDDFRGFYYPYEEMTPGPVVRTTEEVAEAILAAAGAFDPSAVKQFKDTYMCACDGHSTERILALMRDM